MKFQIPRGTVDLLPKDCAKWVWMEQTARKICRLYRYQEVRTPIFEYTELFVRGVGDTTDIVEKEMYTFEDRNQRLLSLRPEGTAGVVRAFVGNKVYAEPQPTKWFYMGPMFRYENPQAGRQRQFHQFGVEVFGSTDPALDAEVIALGMEFFRALGLKGVRVEINNVGDPASRQAYFEKLIEYFSPYKDELAPEARDRLYRNPMRILDSKDPRTKEIAAGAPSILDYLNEESLAHFEAVKNYLELMNIPYVVNDRLVRGLDYYTQTAFEFVVDSQWSQAGTIGGGGRYNRLVEEIGGPDLPGVGFGIGLERVLIALEAQKGEVEIENPLDVYVISMGEEAKTVSMKLLQELRQAGFSADRDYLNRKIKQQLKTANREQAKFVLILGEEELAQGTVQVKDMETGEQEAVSLEQVVSYLSDRLRK